MLLREKREKKKGKNPVLGRCSSDSSCHYNSALDVKCNHGPPGKGWALCPHETNLWGDSEQNLGEIRSSVLLGVNATGAGGNSALKREEWMAGWMAGWMDGWMGWSRGGPAGGSTAIWGTSGVFWVLVAERSHQR